MRIVPILIAAASIAVPVAGVSAQAMQLQRFNAVQLVGGGQVVLKHGPTQRVTLLSGNTATSRLTVLDGHSLRIDACATRCPRDYRLRVEIQSPQISAVAIENGGSIRADGAFPQQSRIAVAVRNGGTVDLRALRSGSVATAIDNGGRIVAGNSRALMIAIRNGGEVAYAGNPSLQTAIANGGKVTRID